MTQSRLTINLKVNKVADWGRTRAFLRKLDPVAVVACLDSLNDVNRILELQSDLPSAKVIARFIDVKHDGGYHTKPDNGQQWLVSPGDFLNAYGRLGQGGLSLYTANEPSGETDGDTIARLSQWMIETIGLANARGISLTVLNWGVGHPRIFNKQWDARFDDVLMLLSKLRDKMYLGMHLYAPADTSERLDALLERCKTLGIKAPRIYVTEFGFDAGYGGDPLNGYKSRGYSGAQFAGWQVEKVRNFYRPYIEDDTVQALATFIWGDSASWRNFDVETDAGWQETILAAKEAGYLTVNSKPVTKPFLTPVPKPVDAADAIRIRVTNALAINIRSGPSTDYTTAGSLNKGDEVTLYQKPYKQAANGQVWRWVDISETLGGWVCTDVLQYEEVKPVIPPSTTTTSDAAMYAYHLKRAEAEFALAQWYKAKMDGATKAA